MSPIYFFTWKFLVHNEKELEQQNAMLYMNMYMLAWIDMP